MTTSLELAEGHLPLAAPAIEVWHAGHFRLVVIEGMSLRDGLRAMVALGYAPRPEPVGALRAFVLGGVA